MDDIPSSSPLTGFNEAGTFRTTVLHFSVSSARRSNSEYPACITDALAVVAAVVFHRRERPSNKNCELHRVDVFKERIPLDPSAGK
jgi:hypothetical protein